jgi:mono/diheme cytochrome c family protein
MIRVRPDGYILVIAVAVIGVLLLPFGAKSASDSAKKPAASQVPLIPSLQGPDLFRSYCAPCHGQDGKGDGPVAPALNSRLPDLTTISKGRGGVFPEKWVRDLITGNQSVVAHGTREMPIWGPIFHQIENDQDYGFVRIRNLTEYLRSIQQK